METVIAPSTSFVDKVQEQRRATIRVMLVHGDIDTDWTTATLAARIGLPEAELVFYVNGLATDRWVDSLIARYLSVAICNWQGGA